jgi:hypothetical protein
MAEPVSTTLSVISAANSLKNLFGGGGSSKPAAKLMGFDVEGTVRAGSGFAGSVTAFDQYGVRWDAQALGNDIRPYALDTLAKLNVPKDSGFTVPIKYTAAPMEGQYALIGGVTSAIESAWSDYKGSAAMNAIFPPSASSLSAPGGSPVQPGTPAGAVPVGGISASASPASMPVVGMSIDSPLLLLILAGAALYFVTKRG